MTTPSARFSRRSLIALLSFMTLTVVFFDAALFILASLAATADASGAPGLPQWVPPGLPAVLVDRFWTMLVPATVVVGLAASLVLWRYLVGLFEKTGASAKDRPLRPGRKAGTAADTPGPDSEAARNRERRLYVHLLCLMQREGRLVDFLFEALDGYSDDRIGAAARSVHSGCRKVLDRHLTLAPLLREAEESDITIAPGFDPGTTTLTGNVIGDPPFQGKVRHRGWRIGRFNLPALSETEDAAVLAPAEVEIA